MSPSGDALAIERVHISLRTEAGPRPLVADVDLRVGPEETVGLVGESGSGKSLTARAALGMFPARAEVGGVVRVAGSEVTGMPERGLLELRRRDVAMVFQDPRASINPVRRIGDFLTEGVRAGGMSQAEAHTTALRLLAEVGIRNPAEAVRRYPHEFSGGMLQRVMIAAAIAIEPSLLLADEPTTALDVTTQAEVVALLERLQRVHRTGMLFVTHNLDLAAAVCDRIYVMYAGRIVETADSGVLFERPSHPYTIGLLRSSPSLAGDRAVLEPIRGRPLALADAPTGCAFRDRCPIAVGACADVIPELRPSGESLTACIRPERAAVL